MQVSLYIPVHVGICKKKYTIPYHTIQRLYAGLCIQMPYMRIRCALDLSMLNVQARILT